MRRGLLLDEIIELCLFFQLQFSRLLRVFRFQKITSTQQLVLHQTKIVERVLQLRNILLTKHKALPNGAAFKKRIAIKMRRLTGRLAQLVLREQLVRHGRCLHTKRFVRDLRADGGRFKQRPIAGVRLDKSAADAGHSSAPAAEAAWLEYKGGSSIWEADSFRAFPVRARPARIEAE